MKLQSNLLCNGIELNLKITTQRAPVFAHNGVHQQPHWGQHNGAREEKSHLRPPLQLGRGLRITRAHLVQIGAGGEARAAGVAAGVCTGLAVVVAFLTVHIAPAHGAAHVGVAIHGAPPAVRAGQRGAVHLLHHRVRAQQVHGAAHLCAGGGVCARQVGHALRPGSQEQGTGQHHSCEELQHVCLSVSGKGGEKASKGVGEWVSRGVRVGRSSGAESRTKFSGGWRQRAGAMAWLEAGGSQCRSVVAGSSCRQAGCCCSFFWAQWPSERVRACPRADFFRVFSFNCWRYSLFFCLF